MWNERKKKERDAREKDSVNEVYGIGARGFLRFFCNHTKITHRVAPISRAPPKGNSGTEGDSGPTLINQKSEPPAPYELV